MYLGNRVEVTGDAAGTHVVRCPQQRTSAERLVVEGAALGQGVCGVGRYYIARPSRTGLALRYARMRERESEEGIKALRGIL